MSALRSVVISLTLGSCVLATAAGAGEGRLAPAFDPADLDQAAMMEAMQRSMTTAEEHEMLGWLLGDWDAETTLWMGGDDGQSMTSSGSVTNEWMLGERFIASHGASTLMGQPMKGLFLIGFDTFAEKYQLVSMSTMGTAIHTAEGYPTRDGSAIVFYGVMDEPMLEVHGRSVKYVFRREGDEQYSIDVHDLHIGEEGNLVMRTVCTRRDS